MSKHYSGNQIEDNEMGTTCGMYGGEDNAYSGVLCGNVKEDDNLKDLGVNLTIILNVKEIGWEGKD